LTSGADRQQHENVDYVETQTDAKAGPVSVTWAPDGMKAVITGHCPECHGVTRTDLDVGIPGTIGLRGWTSRRIPTIPAPLTLYCECGHAHRDRPENAPDKGCGRFWLVYVAAEQRVHKKYLR
jgi:hypothetical protein